jgi:hypothetical protein
MSFARLLRRWTLHRSTLIFAVSLVGFMASGAASAIVIGAVCSGGGQLCNNKAAFPLSVSGAGAVPAARFRAGPFICSNFRIHYFVDGTEVAVTGFVGRLQSTGFVSLGFVAPGGHTVGMQAEGEVSGCNVGNLISWGGKVKIKQGP